MSTVAPIVPILAALITGTVSLTVGVLAYIFGRLQKEHEVRFSRLHERRAEVVAELYQLLHEISVGFERWDGYNEEGDYPSRNDAYRSVKEKLNRFSDLYQQKDILISPELWTRLWEFDRAATKAHSESAVFNLKRKAPTAKGIKPFRRTSQFSSLGTELKGEYEEVLGIGSPRSGAGRRVVMPGLLRLIFGLVGATLIGLGTAGVLYLTKVIPNKELFLWVGIIGLGVGLLLEYVRPTTEASTPKGSRLGAPGETGENGENNGGGQ